MQHWIDQVLETIDQAVSDDLVHGGCFTPNERREFLERLQSEIHSRLYVPADPSSD